MTKWWSILIVSCQRARDLSSSATRCVEDYLKTTSDAATTSKFTEIKTEIEEKIAACACRKRF